jgi:long-chain acyl-CoA synthetase
VHEAVTTNADDTAVLIYTSGTTGRPKGAEITHFQLFQNATTAGELFGIRDDDVVVAVLPFFHIYGLSSVVNIATRYGGTMVAIPRFDAAAVLDVMKRYGATVFSGVPTMFHALLEAGAGVDLPAFRIACSGGSAMPEALLAAFEKRFGVAILEGYGMSETASTATFNVSVDERKIGSVGKPIWGIEAKVIAKDGTELPDGPEFVGELLLRGHNVMKGYFGNPAATAETLRDGWLHTGDLVYRDADGFYFIVDRIKDLIIRGGYNVYPREVEEVLYQHSAVAEAAVISRPDERLGEEVIAVVSLKAGATVSTGELLAHCRTHLAAYKYPREIRIIDALPKSATGKLLKRELR